MSSEQELQIAVVAYAKDEFPILKTLGFHVKNNSPSINQGRLAKRMGVTKGVWDFLILVKSREYCGLAIEFKVAPNKLTPAQEVFRRELERQGYFCAVVYSVEEGRRAISNYMNETIGD